MSVHRRIDAKGRTRYQVKWREHGRQRSRTFDRRRDADAWDVEVKRRTSLGPLAVQQLTATGPTLGEWIAGPWRAEHGSTLAERTRSTYASVYHSHIAADLEHVPLREVTPSRLRAWQAARLEAGVSPATIRHARALLSSALRHAAESEVIVGNPLSVVRAPKLPRAAAVKPLAPVTVERIRNAMLDPSPVKVGDSKEGQRKRRAHTVPNPRSAVERQQDAVLVSLLAYAGLRPSEAFGLNWDDVGEATLLVERATERDGSVKSTKTDSRRSVRLLKPLADDLAAWRDVSAPGPILTVGGSRWTEETYRNWRSRQWRRACQLAGLDPVPRPYDLRHSFASLLLAEARSLHEVAGQLGHSPAMTLGTYGHVLEEFRGRRKVSAEAEIHRARRA